MEEVNIRKAGRSDIADIVESNLKMALETEDVQLVPEVVRKGVETLIEDASIGFYCLAIVDEQIAGQLMILPEWIPWKNAYTWTIQSVYVKPRFRKQGIFRKLYAYVRQTAKEQGATGMKLYVDSDNAKAKNAYSKLGMQSLGKVYEFEEKTHMLNTKGVNSL